MSCYRSGYLAVLDLTGIILCHNTMDIMTVIIKIRNNIQILYRSCILLDQRLLETGYCETGSVQRSTEILYGFADVPSPSAGAREELLLPMIR